MTPGAITLGIVGSGNFFSRGKNAQFVGMRSARCVIAIIRVTGRRTIGQGRCFGNLPSSIHSNCVVTVITHCGCVNMTIFASICRPTKTIVCLTTCRGCTTEGFTVAGTGTPTAVLAVADITTIITRGRSI